MFDLMVQKQEPPPYLGHTQELAATGSSSFNSCDLVSRGRGLSGEGFKAKGHLVPSLELALRLGLGPGACSLNLVWCQGLASVSQNQTGPFPIRSLPTLGPLPASPLSSSSNSSSALK